MHIAEEYALNTQAPSGYWKLCSVECSQIFNCSVILLHVENWEFQTYSFFNSILCSGVLEHMQQRWCRVWIGNAHCSIMSSLPPSSFFSVSVNVLNMIFFLFRWKESSVVITNQRSTNNSIVKCVHKMECRI